MTYYITAEVAIKIANDTPYSNNTAIVKFNHTIDTVSNNEEDRIKNEALALVDSKQISVSGILVTRNNIESVYTKNVTISAHNFIDGKDNLSVVYAIT